jgi:hypothetical protein
VRLGALNSFDVSDVEATIECSTQHEYELRKARDIARRAFAQGFTAALEDGNASEWLEHYQERS